MKERLKELWYWFEDRLKDLCGELTPDKRIATILIMLLILTVGNLYFTVSTIYNWGKESEKKRGLEIEHIGKPETQQDKNEIYDFPIDRELFDLHKQKMRRDSTDSMSINKQKFKEYERTTENIFRANAKT